MNKLFFLPLAALLVACDGDANTDGGTDASSEQPFDICATFTSAGDTCAHASNVVCFKDPTCNLPNGCSCKDDGGGPKWTCSTPQECIHPCGNSGEAGAACDAGDDAPAEADTDAADAGDASSD